MENNKSVAEEQLNNTVEGESTETTQEETVTLSKAELDQLIQTAEEATAIAQKREADAENYKRGMLKYKGKLSEVGLDDEEEDERPQISEDRIAQIVAEQLKPIVEQLKPKETQDELSKAKNTIEEMKVALNSRAQVRSVSGGSNMDKGEIKASAADKYFSPEQINELKAKFPHLDPNDILKNMPGNNTGQAGFANGSSNA